MTVLANRSARRKAGTILVMQGTKRTTRYVSRDERSCARARIAIAHACKIRSFAGVELVLL